MASPIRREGDSLVTLRPATRVPELFGNSLYDRAERDVLRKRRNSGSTDSSLGEAADHLGLEDLGEIYVGGGKWEVRFGQVRVPGIETEEEEVRAIGLGRYTATTMSEFGNSHIVVGIRRNAPKTGTEFQDDLTQLSKNLIDRPWLARVADNRASRFLSTFPVTALAGLVLVDAAAKGINLVAVPGPHIPIDDMATNNLILGMSAVSGSIVGLLGEGWASSAIVGLRARQVERNVPNLSESFADDVAYQQLWGQKHFVDGRRVQVEAFQGLGEEPANFRALYSLLTRSPEGPALINKRHSELPPVSTNLEPSETSEGIVEALKALHQSRKAALKALAS